MSELVEIADYINGTGRDIVYVDEVKEHLEEKHGEEFDYDVVKEQMIECAKQDLIAFFDTGDTVIDSEGVHPK